MAPALSEAAESKHTDSVAVAAATPLPFLWHVLCDPYGDGLVPRDRCALRAQCRSPEKVSG